MSRRSAHGSPVLIPEGSLLLDRYLVQKILGKGASGVVYRGFDQREGQEVAIKAFPASLRENKLASARLHREIRSAHRIESNYVTKLYNCHITDDFIILILEYVHGVALSEYLKKNQTIPIPTVCRIIRQVSRGLEAIHEQNIIHRDIKLENIMLSDSGDVKITDFGISSWTEDTETFPFASDQEEANEAQDISHADRLTVKGKVVGTLQYISPEYLLGEECDERGDIYALGVLLYELITGKYLYRYTSHADLMEKKVNADPRPPLKLRPDCPEWLNNVCMKALSRNPKERYQKAKEVAFEFNRPGVLFASDDSSGFSSTAINGASRTSIMDLRHQSAVYDRKFIQQARRRKRGWLPSFIRAPLEFMTGGPLSHAPILELLLLGIVVTGTLLFLTHPTAKYYAKDYLYSLFPSQSYVVAPAVKKHTPNIFKKSNRAKETTTKDSELDATQDFTTP
ncbi:MAG: serine/threonine protein kinase [Bdellovibrionales bacterium]|nr:serine/threonine protein kinase [Bdellovibrionales bacterium]